MAVKWFHRNGNSLFPADDAALAALNKYQDEDLVGLQFKKIRSPRHHRRYFAMLSMVLETQDYYKSVEHFLVGLKLHLGMIENIVQLRSGEQTYQLKSIAFDKMDQHEFQELDRTTKDFIAKQVLPGITEREMRENLEGFIQ